MSILVENVWRPLLLLWGALGRNRRRQFIALLLLSIVSALAEVANLGALFPVLKLLSSPSNGIEISGIRASQFAHLSQQHLLIIFGCSFLLVILLSTILRVLTIQVQLRLGALMAADIGDKIFSAVLHKPFDWHLNNNSSSVLGNLTKDVDQAYGSIQALLVIVVNISLVVFMLTSLIVSAPEIMLVVSSLLVSFYFLVYRFTRSSLQAEGQRLTLSYESSLKVAQEALGGIRDVILDKSQAYFLGQYRFDNRNYRLASASINSKAQIPRYLIEGFVLLLIIVVSLIMAIAGRSIDKQLPVLGILSLGAYRLLQPLQQSFGSFSYVKANHSSLSRLSPYLCFEDHESLSAPLKDCLHEHIHKATKLLVEFVDVGFRYSADGPWILNNISLPINIGDSVALVGSTGSGKSTCSDLILGLLEPTVGNVLVNGRNLHANPDFLMEWQTRVAHVPQQIYLKDASFTANIAFGVPENDIDHEMVRYVAQKALISDLIDSSIDGYDTIVGERGIRLSGGQRQRIGIARALYKKAELLVLDESTSALDNLTEARLMSSINSFCVQTTLVIIAHRLSTIKNCSRIIYLDKGNILAAGTYEYLAEHCKPFNDLITVQYQSIIADS